MCSIAKIVCRVLTCGCGLFTKEPKQRFGSVQAFANALEQASQPTPAKEEKPSIAPSLPPTHYASPPLLEQKQLANISSVPITNPPSAAGQPQSKPATEVPLFRQPITEKPTKQKSIWSIGKREIVATIVGVAVTCIAGNFLFRLSGIGFSITLTLSLILFFGAVFGPWVGLANSMISYLISTSVFSLINLHFWVIGTNLYSSTYHGSARWQFLVGYMLIGFASGLALFLSQRRYNSIRSIVSADILGNLGILIGLSLAWLTYYNVYFLTRYFVPIILYTIIPSLIVLPILLFAYDKIAHHNKVAK